MAKHKSKDGSEKAKPARAKPTIPPQLVPPGDAPVLKTPRGSFDLEDPVLPAWLDDAALGSGGYPYTSAMKREPYEEELKLLQVELVKLQRHVTDAGLKVVAIFEGRDSAGKGGAILAIREFMNPRTARLVALPKPTETERGQWYFERYVAQLPTAGEIVLFDRSWYNRGGVEPVMGFCTAAEAREFLVQAPALETMLVNSGIALFKFWLDIGREMQLKQFHQRRHDPLKIWKLSPIDYVAMEKWTEYGRARDRMIKATHKPATPWTIVRSNDKRRARLAVIRKILTTIDYPGRDKKVAEAPDPRILGTPRLLADRAR